MRHSSGNEPRFRGGAQFELGDDPGSGGPEDPVGTDPAYLHEEAAYRLGESGLEVGPAPGGSHDDYLGAVVGSAYSDRHNARHRQEPGLDFLLGGGDGLRLFGVTLKAIQELDQFGWTLTLGRCWGRPNRDTSLRSVRHGSGIRDSDRSRVVA